MSIKLKGRHHDHEEGAKKSLKLMQQANADAVKVLGSDVSKTATLVKAGTAAEDLAGPVSEPTAEQLAAINEFTRTPKTAEEVYVFTTLSMNNLPDRDDDFFFTETVQGFADLPQPFSPTGKSFMLDHAYSVGNAVGRIFSTDTATVEVDASSGLKPIEGGDAFFLMNGIYIPRTERYAGFVEDLDFGINWAVSVGVTLGATECTICGDPFSSWGWWCVNGHDKGAYYDPDSEAYDEYGWPLMADPEDPKAKLCLRGFKDARDMYELSQVFLGAQYFAALDKKAGLKKGAVHGLTSIPQKFAKEIEFPKVPQKVAEARRAGLVDLDAEGNEVWVDSQGLGWSYTLGAEAALCTGKSDLDDDETDTNSNGEEDNHDGTERTTDAGEPGTADGQGDDPSGSGDPSEGEDGQPAEDGTEAGDGSSAEPVSESADEDEPEGSDPEADENANPDNDPEGNEDDDEEPAPDGDDPETSAVAAFVALLPTEARSGLGKKFSLPAAVKAMEVYLSVNRELVTAGRAYVEQLRADALGWYTKANMDPKAGKGVNTTTFEKILDMAGNDTDLLTEMIEEQKQLALKRWPKTSKSRRSSAPEDVETRTPVADIEDYEAKRAAEKAEALHG